MKLRDVSSKEEFGKFYKDNNLNTIEEKIKYLEEEMGILWTTGDLTPEENLATLELHCLKGWDRVSCRKEKKEENVNMITKKELADFIIRDFIYSLKEEEQSGLIVDGNKINYDKVNNYVPQCTTLGIALEFTGHLADGYKDYIDSRSGVTIFPDIWESCYIKKIMRDKSMTKEEQDDFIYNHSITIRKLFNLLPD